MTPIREEVIVEPKDYLQQQEQQQEQSEKATSTALTNNDDKNAQPCNDNQNNRGPPEAAAASQTVNDDDNADSTIGPCCWFWKYGKCEPPRPPCRFRHDIKDDGIRPCCFGATCRLGHKRRVTAQSAYNPQVYFQNQNKQVVGKSPAVRNATLLRSQLEPWPTATLRQRLADFEQIDHAKLDPLKRGEIMQRLLDYYDHNNNTDDGRRRRRQTIQVQGMPLQANTCLQLLQKLQEWQSHHGAVNTRPSINAESYMILRHPREFPQEASPQEQPTTENDQHNDGQETNPDKSASTSTTTSTTLSHQAELAKKKLAQYRSLFDLAEQALQGVDPTFEFSALAVTYNFKGSPHIDKQNTGPFYGLSLGNFEEGGVCVEVDPWTVAHCHTHNQFSKVDGRYPHWVAPYTGERYSLIYYSTKNKYQPRGPAYFGTVASNTSSSNCNDEEKKQIESN